MIVRWVAILAVLLAVVAVPAHAQTTRSGGDNARAMQQLQQLASERTALQAENVRLKRELEEAQQKLAAASAQQGALARRAQAAEVATSRLAASNDASAESAARTRAQLDELVVTFRETALLLKDTETERNTLRQQLQAAERQLGTCRTHNAELIDMNDEVLERLEDTGFWTRLAAAEPFTRIKRTRLENLAAEYRGRAQEFAEPVPPAPTP